MTDKQQEILAMYVRGRTDLMRIQRHHLILMVNGVWVCVVLAASLVASVVLSFLLQEWTLYLCIAIAFIALTVIAIKTDEHRATAHIVESIYNNPERDYCDLIEILEENDEQDD